MDPAPATARLLLATRGLRAVADGFVSILLPAYLLALGLDAFQVGVVATATMLGSAALTLAVGFGAARHDGRTLLLAAAGLMALTGLGFAWLQGFWPLLLVAFVGTLNPSSGDVSLFLPLEQAMLTSAVPEARRTAMFARYALTGSLLAAAGTLLAVLPDLAARHLGTPPLRALSAMFLLYAAIGLAAGLLYRRLPRLAVPDRRVAALGPSRRRVYHLAALFCLDSFAGGLVVQSLLALFLLQRFDLSLAATARLLFWAGLLTALSQLLAPVLARRIGLVRTMVLTHLPANACLIAVALVPELWQAVTLLLVRAALSQMDVPARASFVMAVVTPPERPAAASLTAVPRSLAAALSPMLAGWLLGAGGFGWPLVLAGGLKIAYDLLLLRAFDRVRPPEEADRS